MSDKDKITNNGVLLAEDEVMYVVSFYPSQNGEESPETLINRLLQKEVMKE